MKQRCHFCQGEVAPSGDVCHDEKKLRVVRCLRCDLAQLEDFSHIGVEYYASGDFLPDAARERERQREWNRKRIREVRERIPGLANATLLDFGSGTAGFLESAQGIFKKAYGFDLNGKICESHQKEGWNCFNSLERIPPHEIDIVTLFHVLEHVPKPWELLAMIADRFAGAGNIVIEVPNTQEALLSLFHCGAYRANHYHKVHLYYFTEKTLRKIVHASGLVVEHSSQIQKYSLGNHMGWLSERKGGGQERFPFLNDERLNCHYERLLAQQGIADSLLLFCGRGCANGARERRL